MDTIDVDHELICSRAPTPAFQDSAENRRKPTPITTSYGVKDRTEVDRLREMKIRLDMRAAKKLTSAGKLRPTDFHPIDRLQNSENGVEVTFEKTGEEEFFLPLGRRWIGVLIGRNGQVVQAMQRDSGARISFCDEANACLIWGTSSARRRAIDLIRMRVQGGQAEPY